MGPVRDAGCIAASRRVRKRCGSGVSALCGLRPFGHLAQGAVQIDEATDLAGRNAVLAEVAQARVAGAFGKLAASRIGHQAMVGVDRFGAIEQNLE